MNYLIVYGILRIKYVKNREITMKRLVSFIMSILLMVSGIRSEMGEY